MTDSWSTTILSVLSVLFAGLFLGALLFGETSMSGAADWVTASATLILAAFAAQGLNHFRKTAMIKRQSELAEEILDLLQEKVFDFGARILSIETGSRLGEAAYFKEIQSLITQSSLLQDDILNTHIKAERIGEPVIKSLMRAVDASSKHRKEITSYLSPQVKSREVSERIMSYLMLIDRQAEAYIQVLTSYYRMDPNRE